jgi:hypothetical protein
VISNENDDFRYLLHAFLLLVNQPKKMGNSEAFQKHDSDLLSKHRVPAGLLAASSIFRGCVSEGQTFC